MGGNTLWCGTTGKIASRYEHTRLGTDRGRNWSITAEFGLLMNRPYNLWILNHYAGNLRDGMEYRHFYLARHLRRMGHRVSLISSTYSHLFSSPPQTSGLIEYGDVDGVEFVWLRGPRYQGNGIKRLANMLSYSVLAQIVSLDKYLGKPDVILGSTPHPFVLWNTLKLAKRYGVSSVVEIRDLWPLMLIELGSMSARHPLARMFQYLENKAFRDADRVISLWHSANIYMFKHGLSSDRYRYLPNGIELDDIIFEGSHPLLDAVEAQRASGRFIVGYGGSHGHANPLNQVIDACLNLQSRGIKDIAFFMVGDGPDKVGARQRAESLKLQNLHWFDPVPKDVIMAFYAKLDATFIGLRDLPLFKYGPTPNKLMDYLAAGNPIIYAIRSSFDPVAENDLGLSILPDDGQALAKALIQLRDTPVETRDRMGERARKFAEKEHSYKTLAERLDKIVSELL